MRQNEGSVQVPCEPTHAMLIAGCKALDAWADETLQASIDDAEMVRRVWRAMTSAGEDVLR